MVDFPRLKRTVAIKSASIPDFQTAYSNFGKQIQNFTGGVASEINTVEGPAATAKGKKEGSVIGAKDPGQGFTYLGRKEKAAFDQAQQATIQNDIAANAPRILNDTIGAGKYNPVTAQNSFNASWKDYSDGLLAKVPEDSKRNAENYLQYFHTRGLNKVNEMVNRSNENDMTNTLYKNLDVNQNIAKQSFFKGNDTAALAAIGQSNRKIVTALAGGLVTPAQAENLRLRVASQSNEARYLGGFERALQGGKSQEFLQKFDKANQSDLNFDQKRILLSKMYGRLHEHEQTLGINLATANAQKRGVLDNLSHSANLSGQQPTIDYLQKFYPDLLTKEEISTAQQIGSYRKELLYFNPSEAQKVFDVIKPNPNEADFESKMRLRDTLQTEYTSNRKELFHDSFSYNLEHSAVVNSYINRQTAASDSSGKVQPNSPNSITPVQNNLFAQQNEGVPPRLQRVMPVDSAQQYVNDLSTMNPSEKLSEINKIMPQYEADGSKVANIAIRDLSKAGLPQNINIVYEASRNPLSRGKTVTMLGWVGSNPNDVDSSFKALGNDDTKLQASVTDKLVNFNGSLDYYPGDASTQKAQINAQAMSFAKYLMVKNSESGNKGIFSDSALTYDQAAQEAYDLIIGNNYNFPKINSKPMLVSYKYDPDLFVNAYNAKLTKAKASDLSVPDIYKNNYPDLDDKDLKQQYLEDSVNDGYVLTNDTQSSSKLVDSYGSPLKTIDGKTFDFNPDELSNPMSNIRKEIYDNRGVISKSLDIGKTVLQKTLDVASEVTSSSPHLVNQLITHKREQTRENNK